MTITNREHVGKAMDLLKTGLAPFVEREFKNLYAGRALAEARRVHGEDRMLANKKLAEWDALALLNLMLQSWQKVFHRKLGHAGCRLVRELRDVRHKWAHQQCFSEDDTDRALDSVERLLTAVSAPQAADVRKVKMELRRTISDEQARNERRRSAGTTIDSAVPDTVRETPHEQGDPAPDLRRRFWTAFLARPLLQGSPHAGLRRHARLQPRSGQWLSAGAGRAGLAYNYNIKVTWTDVELHIKHTHRQENYPIFAALRQQQAEIKDRFGGPLEWIGSAESPDCHIRFIVPDGTYRETARWPEIHDAMIRAMTRLMDALDPAIATLTI